MTTLERNHSKVLGYYLSRGDRGEAVRAGRRGYSQREKPENGHPIEVSRKRGLTTRERRL